MNNQSPPVYRRPVSLGLAILPAAAYAVFGLAGFLDECRQLDAALVEAYGHGYEADTGLLALGGLVQLVLVTTATLIAGLLTAHSTRRSWVPSNPR